MSELSDYPEMYYFMNEEESDVVFMVEGQRVPAIKIILCIKNRVFRAMFSGTSKESKDKTVVIEETSFDAFQTMILFLYTERLVFKDENDLKLIEEVCELSDKYEANRLMRETTKRLTKIAITLDNLQQISRIAFRYKMEELMAKVMTFIDNNFNEIVNRDHKQLRELNDSTNNELLVLLAKNCRKIIKELSEIKEKTKHFQSGNCVKLEQ